MRVSRPGYPVEAKIPSLYKYIPSPIGDPGGGVRGAEGPTYSLGLDPGIAQYSPTGGGSQYSSSGGGYHFQGVGEYPTGVGGGSEYGQEGGGAGQYIPGGGGGSQHLPSPVNTDAVAYAQGRGLTLGPFYSASEGGGGHQYSPGGGAQYSPGDPATAQYSPGSGSSQYYPSPQYSPADTGSQYSPGNWAGSQHTQHSPAGSVYSPGGGTPQYSPYPSPYGSRQHSPEKSYQCSPAGGGTPRYSPYNSPCGSRQHSPEKSCHCSPATSRHHSPEKGGSYLLSPGASAAPYPGARTGRRREVGHEARQAGGARDEQKFPWLFKGQMSTVGGGATSEQPGIQVSPAQDSNLLDLGDVSGDLAALISSVR